MDQVDLLHKFAATCDKHHIRYAVVGSIASTMYGEPRLTLDIDVVIDLQLGHLESFCAEFPAAEYYLSRSAVESAVRKRQQFNIIHPASGLRIDCILAADAFDAGELDRARTVQAGGGEVRVATPEDVIIKKLEYFRLGQSEKHIRDIAGILKGTAGVDRDYILQWAERKGLAEVWEAALARVGE